ncbi:MAG TPA: hypothetical protein VKD91_05890 [Pyrinomonadaceae bacterium]|nr:hypothetical protein [Pyrinomonadaceae bacterium]
MRSRAILSTLSLTVMLVMTGTRCVRAQASGPTLLSEESSPGAAAALDSVTRVRSPLPVVAVNNFSRDHRTRLSLFATNVELNAGENASAVTATARDSRPRVHSLSVEFVGKVPSQTWLTQIIVRLPDSLAQAGGVWISISLHGQTSNEVLFNIAVQTEPRTVQLAARRIINGIDNYTVATFSFEFGVNGDAALPLTRNDWDILFGNNPSRDTFRVTMVVDDRSRIRDLGALNWSDSFQVPVIPAYPVPTTEPDVDAVVGHMYVVHTKDTETDLYALFRVEALEPRKSVTITWKSVQSPEDP